MINGDISVVMLGIEIHTLKTVWIFYFKINLQIRKSFTNFDVTKQFKHG